MYSMTQPVPNSRAVICRIEGKLNHVGVPLLDVGAPVTEDVVDDFHVDVPAIDIAALPAHEGGDVVVVALGQGTIRFVAPLIHGEGVLGIEPTPVAGVAIGDHGTGIRGLRACKTQSRAGPLRFSRAGGSLNWALAAPIKARPKARRRSVTSFLLSFWWFERACNLCKPMMGAKYTMAS